MRISGNEICEMPVWRGSSFLETSFGGAVLPQVHFCRAAVQACIDRA